MTQLWEPVKKVTNTAFNVFGPGEFGKRAEAFARFFGTPSFLITQTVIVVVWIVLNSVALTYQWDPYPFILLNLMFSLQAAYAAPLILLAQTRQADRDRLVAEAEANQREAIATATIKNQEEAIALAQRLLEEVGRNTSLLETLNPPAPADK